MDRSTTDTLATCAYVRATENVLFMRPPGVGKSHLAIVLGVKAINGFATTHFVLDDLMHVLKGDAAIPPRRLKARRYPSYERDSFDSGGRSARPPGDIKSGESRGPAKRPTLRSGSVLVPSATPPIYQDIDRHRYDK